MTDVFDIDLYRDSTSAEVEHQLHRLRAHPLWAEAMSDPMHPSNKIARRALGGLVRAKDEAMEAERFRPAAAPADVTPEAAGAMHDRLMADPAFRRAYRDSESPRQEHLTNVVQQLLHWAHPPAGTAEARRSTASGIGAPAIGAGDGRSAPAARSSGGNAIADRLADGDFMAAYLDAAHPGHADAMSEMTGLHEAAATDAAATNE